MISDFSANPERHRIAEAMKTACLKAAVEAYEHARMSGLCQEGAWDCALDAIRALDVETVLTRLPGPAAAGEGLSPG